MTKGLLDEAILRFYSKPFDCLFEDGVAVEMIARCRKKEVPIAVNRYISYAEKIRETIFRNGSG